MSRVTRWYPAKIKPVHKGWYEISGYLYSPGLKYFWNGRKWLVPLGYTKSTFGNLSKDQWRGLKEPAC